MSKPQRKPVDVQSKPILDVPSHSYQPSKAELEADASIEATPDELARALMRDVTVRTKSKAP